MNPQLIPPLDQPLAGTGQVRIIAPSAGVDGSVSIGEVVVVRGSEPPRCRHRHEDLLVFVVRGRLDFHINARTCAAVPGTWIVVSRGSEYAYAVASERAHLLVILTPAGAESCLFALYGSAPALAVAGEQGAAVERLVTTAARHGIDITGPPLAPERG